MLNIATSYSKQQKTKQISIKADFEYQGLLKFETLGQRKTMLDNLHQESVRGIMVQNTLLADQCICEVLQVWPISQYLRIERSVNRNCISGIFLRDYLSSNTRLGLQENRDMFDTPNGGFFYSYIVVLGHYSRVILCLVFGVCWNLLQSL